MELLAVHHAIYLPTNLPTYLPRYLVPHIHIYTSLPPPLPRVWKFKGRNKIKIEERRGNIQYIPRGGEGNEISN